MNKGCAMTTSKCLEIQTAQKNLCIIHLEKMTVSENKGKYMIGK